jgi:hypothetical protein
LQLEVFAAPRCVGDGELGAVDAVGELEDHREGEPTTHEQIS